MDKRKEQFESRLEHARILLENSRIVESEKYTKKILDDYPDNAEALYVLAVCQRYLNRLENALTTLNWIFPCAFSSSKRWNISISPWRISHALKI